MTLIILPDPPHVVEAYRRREMARRAEMRESVGVPCPKCQTKNLHDDGFSVGWTGGANHVGRTFMCRHCGSQYEQVTEFAMRFDPNLGCAENRPVKTYVRMAIER
ncbi:MAG: hypothetical protein WC277_04875 [Bacilli bacterium]